MQWTKNDNYQVTIAVYFILVFLIQKQWWMIAFENIKKKHSKRSLTVHIYVAVQIFKMVITKIYQI